VFWLCRLRASLPFFFAAIETGIVLAMLGAITGEFVGAQSGLGYLVVQKNAVMSIDGVFALLIVLGIVGVGLHLAVRAIHHRVVFWE
jgi:NitT/TauT family transport system permease protein